MPAGAKTASAPATSTRMTPNRTMPNSTRAFGNRFSRPQFRSITGFERLDDGVPEQRGVVVRQRPLPRLERDREGDRLPSRADLVAPGRKSIAFAVTFQ